MKEEEREGKKRKGGKEREGGGKYLHLRGGWGGWKSGRIIRGQFYHNHQLLVACGEGKGVRKEKERMRGKKRKKEEKRREGKERK